MRRNEAIPMFRTLVTSPPSAEAVYRRHGLVPVEVVFTEEP